MKIIIAGAGQIGTHIAKMYSFDEANEITLIDNTEETLEYAARTCDISTKVASCTVIADLRAINIETADLFIAVTNLEEANILGCTLAKKLGAKKVIARVKNTEYVDEDNLLFFQELGVDSCVSPEKLAAEEIISHLKFTRCKRLQSLTENNLNIYSIRIIKGSDMIGKTVEEMYESFNVYHTKILGIKRKTKSILAKSAHNIEESDLIFVISSEENIVEIQNICNSQDFVTRSIIILGGSRIGALVAKNLQNSMNVKLIEKNKNKCLELVETLDKSLVINGDGTNIELLKEHGINKTDIFISVTENSETNILSSLLAKGQGVKETIAEVENISLIELASNTGIDIMINKKMIAVNYIYKYTCLSALLNSYMVAGADAAILVFKVNEKAKITKYPLKKMAIPENINIGAVARDGELLDINDETHVATNDDVVVFASLSSLVALDKLF